MKVRKLQNKLVRDNEPSRLENTGVSVELEQNIDDERYLRLLIDRLGENAADIALTFDDDTLLDLLVDLETAVDGILKAKGFTRAQLRDKQEEKDAQQGTYEKKTFIISTEEEDDN